MNKLIYQYKKWGLYKKITLWIAVLAFLSPIIISQLNPSKFINNVASPESINIIGDKNIINKTEISDPKCLIGSFTQNHQNERWETGFVLDAEPKISLNKLYLQVSDPTIIDLSHDSKNLYEISQEVTDVEGLRQLVIEKPIPPYRITVLTHDRPDMTNLEFIKCRVE
ncbi:MAG: hypothetical protein WC862_05070 [Patescibacteria group bacterium]